LNHQTSLDGGRDNSQIAIDDDDQDDFNVFFEELKKEAKAYGLDEEPSEEDARELFKIMLEEYATGEIFTESQDDEDDEAESRSRDILDQDATHNSATAELSNREIDASLSIGEHTDVTEPLELDLASSETSIKTENKISPASVNRHDELAELEPEKRAKLRELQLALPGLPISRLKKVLKAFESTLSYPSILTLVPILRETLPDHLTSGRLKRMNENNAEFVFQKAEEYRLVDTSLLNSMLQVKTSASSLDDAERFHREEFRRHNLKPTAYSDRLVLQMFVENGRLQRALNFKQSIERDKRTLDLPSYGTLIDYYAKHHQLGSAIVLLKECLALYGSPPSEKYLSSTRVLARQLQMEEKLRLTQLIGKDPIEWLKYGERFLKRERSKKGRRNIQLANNRILG